MTSDSADADPIVRKSRRSSRTRRQSDGAQRSDRAAKTASSFKWNAEHFITAGFCIGLMALLDVMLRVRSASVKTLDFQTGMKLALWGGSAAWAAYNYKKVLPMLNRASLPWIVLFGWLTLTALYSPAPLLTAISGLSVLAVMFFFFFALRTLGERRTVELMIWGMSLIMLASVIYAVADPAAANTIVKSDGQEEVTHRLLGFTGQPNTLGRIGAFAAILAGIYWQEFLGLRRYVVMAIGVLGVAVIVLAESRTSAIAVMVAAGYYYAFRARWRWALPLFVVAVSVAVMVVAPNFDKVAAGMARSRDASEIYTLTNRTYIWKLERYMIMKKPVLGWGYNTAAFTLGEYKTQGAPELRQYVPPNAHQAYLEVTYGGGFVALALLAVAMISNIVLVLRRRAARATALTIFWISTSITEVAGFTGIVTTSTITMLLPIGLTALLIISGQDGAGAARRRRRPAAIESSN